VTTLRREMAGKRRKEIKSFPPFFKKKKEKRGTGREERKLRRSS